MAEQSITSQPNSSDPNSKPSENTITLPVLVLPGAVAFPATVVTITLESPNATVAVAAAADVGGQLLLLAEIEGRSTTVGVIGHIEQTAELPNGTRVAVIRTLQRALVLSETASERSGRWMTVEPLAEPRPTPRNDATARELRAVAEGIAEARRSRRLPEILRTTTHPGELVDAITAWSETGVDHRLTVLELTELGARLEFVLSWAKDLLGELNVSAKIRDDVTEGMDKQQREYLLRQQMAAIRKELGEEDGAVEDYRAKLDALGNRLPDVVRTAVLRELERLERTSGQSPEQSWIRSWLDRVFDLPWAVRSDEQIDIAEARRVLDADHSGLDDVKERIVEFLAVRKLRNERTPAEPDTDVKPPASARRNDGAIILLAGPPGVGKTSLGESVARAMGRQFVRVALGGVRDEAEIRGHRRTYVGAQPGRIVRAIGEAGSMNPVILLDEIDKLSAGGWSGDPTAALLEVLDPAQNHTFRDHYLEVELDLSDVVFLATANTLETIPAPLLDRMEVIRLAGYTEDEKVNIATRYLVPKQMKGHGLKDDELVVSESALRDIMRHYTREAGVRSLEREISKICRKVVKTIVQRGSKVAALPVAAVKETKGSKVDAAKRVTVTARNLPTYLGVRKYTYGIAEKHNQVGQVTGLAWTEVGGELLTIEAVVLPGKGKMTTTGKLGDVMQESIQAALSVVRGRARKLGLADDFYQKNDIHIHLPEGATPKDGPSAGIGICTAMVSVLSGVPVRADVAMTGEITLRGEVLPIGGLKEKLLAALRGGIKIVLIPQENVKDLADIPDTIKTKLDIRPVKWVDEVLALALERAPEPLPEPVAEVVAPGVPLPAAVDEAVVTPRLKH